MRGVPRGLIVAALVLGQALAMPALAEEFLVRVRGEVVGARLSLSAEFGPAVRLGAKIYSEPSHTLLFVAADPGFAATAEGDAWLQGSRDEKALAIVTSPLPAARPTVEIKARPSADDHVAVSILRREPDGGLQDWVVSQAYTGAGSFAFSTSLLEKERFHHCCEGGGCPQMCVDCTRPEFWCCLVYPPPSCCEISCYALNCCPP